MLRLLSDHADDDVEGGIGVGLSADGNSVAHLVAYNSDGVIVVAMRSSQLPNSIRADYEVPVVEVKQLLSCINDDVQQVELHVQGQVLVTPYITMKVLEVYEPIRSLLSKPMRLKQIGSFDCSELLGLTDASTLEVGGCSAVQRDEDGSITHLGLEIEGAKYGAYLSALFKRATQVMRGTVYVQQSARFNDLVLDGVANGHAIRFIIYNLN